MASSDAATQGSALTPPGDRHFEPKLPAAETAPRLREAAAGLRASDIVARTGVSLVSLHRYLKGRSPSLSFVEAFCREFGFSADWILLGRGPRKPDRVSRWAQETAGPADLCAAVGTRLEAGDREIAAELAQRMGIPQYTTARQAMAMRPRSTG